MVDNGVSEGGSFRHIVVVIVGVGGLINNPNKCTSNIRGHVHRFSGNCFLGTEIKDAVFPGWSDVPEFDGDTRFQEIRWEVAGITSAFLDASYIYASLYWKFATYGAEYAARGVTYF